MTLVDAAIGRAAVLDLTRANPPPPGQAVNRGGARGARRRKGEDETQELTAVPISQRKL